MPGPFILLISDAWVTYVFILLILIFEKCWIAKISFDSLFFGGKQKIRWVISLLYAL